MQDPVCTPSGNLFSREAILENLLDQKKANKRKLAAWEAQQADDARKQVGGAVGARVGVRVCVGGDWRGCVSV